MYQIIDIPLTVFANAHAQVKNLPIDTSIVHAVTKTVIASQTTPRTVYTVYFGQSGNFSANVTIDNETGEII